jgi:hypothetical protein
MKPNQCQYYKASIKSCNTHLEFESLAEMCKYVEQNNITSVFVATDAALQQHSFVLYQNGCVTTHPTLGFNTLEHFITAQEKGFPDASTFYEAQQLGYTKYNDYLLVKEAGIADVATFETIKKKGFIAGFEEYKKLITEQPNLLQIDDVISNPYQLYQYSRKHHFEDFNVMIDAFSKGFVDADLYASAKELGFPTFNDFTEASNKQFRTYKELAIAREMQIRDSNDFHRYIDLEVLRKNGESHDQLLLLIVLSKLEQGKRISLNKLTNILKTNIEEYKYADTQEMPLWFTLTNEADIVTFLQKNNEVKRYGNYDVDGEFFEISKMQDRAVVIDASNVAHNSNIANDKKIFANNVILMVEFLKTKGFDDITVIADASLRHKVTDQDKYEELKKNYTYLEAPRENPADIFILQQVKTKHCLVVSNDTFRQWKIQDPWVADNVDFYRLSFMIKGNEVIMPDIK